jgi:hypothetical protein
MMSEDFSAVKGNAISKLHRVSVPENGVTAGDARSAFIPHCTVTTGTQRARK